MKRKIIPVLGVVATFLCSCSGNANTTTVQTTTSSITDTQGTTCPLSTTLDTPVLKTDENNNIYWEPVSGATGYKCIIRGEEYYFGVDCMIPESYLEHGDIVILWAYDNTGTYNQSAEVRYTYKITATLEAPKLSYNKEEGILSWEDVVHANVYKVYINGKVRVIDTTYIDLSDYGRYDELSISAYDINLIYSESEKTIFHNPIETKLDQPKPYFNDGNLIWKPIDNATGYECTINGVKLDLDGRSIIYSTEFQFQDTIEIWAIDQTGKNRDSEKATVIINEKIALEIPAIEIDYDNYVVSFSSLGATSYMVSVNGENYETTDASIKLKEYDTFSVRACNKETSEYSNWSESKILHFDYGQLNVGDADEAGNVSLSYTNLEDEYLEYYIIYVDGVDMGHFPRSTTSYHLELGQTIEVVYKDTRSQKLCDLQYDATKTRIVTKELTIDLSSMKNIQTDGDYTYFDLTTSSGDTIKLKAYKIKLEDGLICLLGKDSYIFTQNPLGGIIHTSSSVLGEEESLSASSLQIETGCQFRDDSSNIVTDPKLVTNVGIVLSSHNEYSSDINIGDYAIISNYGSYIGVDAITKIRSITLDYVGGSAIASSATFDTNFYKEYVEGEVYRDFDEVIDPPKIYTFYLNVSFYNSIYNKMTNIAHAVKDFEIISLNDENGNVIDFNSRVYKGYSLSLDLGSTINVKLPIIEADNAYNTIHELSDKKATSSTGMITNIVIPISFNDLSYRENADVLTIIKNSLGNVTDGFGNVTTYSANNPASPSLSEFYAISSMNQLAVQSFITDFYRIDADFSDICRKDIDEYVNDIMAWFEEHYKAIPKNQFDSDNNQEYDSVIFFNVGDIPKNSSYVRVSYQGGYVSRTEKEESAIKEYMNLGLNHCFSSLRLNEGEFKTDTIIHEFGHVLGLNDYYDNSGYGMSFIGSYDVQSSNGGDWNPYSKYLVGWTTPTEINDDFFLGAQSKTITLDSFNLSNQVLILRADNSNSPFGEYIMIDLFDGSAGLNARDSESFGLKDTVGLRILHVNSNMYDKSFLNTNYCIGDESYRKYELVMIQANEKTFLTKGGRNQNRSSDYFTEGATFSVSAYSNFFYEGLMDNGVSIPYSIHVDSITENPNGGHTATITITKI